MTEESVDILAQTREDWKDKAFFFVLSVTKKLLDFT